MPRAERDLDRLWAEHGEAWRDPMAVVAGSELAAPTDPQLLRSRVRGDFWKAVAKAKVTLLVSREYEHLLLSLSVRGGKPVIGYVPLPHPSGIAYDARRKRIHVASTRNPNRVIDFAPPAGTLPRGDSPKPDLRGNPLLPTAMRFYPGSLYMHDLAMVGGRLHANAVGENAVVHLGRDGGFDRAWWPKAIERRGKPDFSRNHIQLNSIAAGKSLRDSFFTASATAIGPAKPGQKRFPVDRRGAVFSGATREPVVTGLTRPHSARLRRGRVWVLDSGYGGVCTVRDGGLETATRLPGWTRGLGIAAGIAFAATSRVIPKFSNYAPGLDIAKSVCGVHAVDIATGETLGSLVWPRGNQIFAVEAVPSEFSVGFPLRAGTHRPSEQLKRLFYAYLPPKEPS